MSDIQLKVLLSLVAVIWVLALVSQGQHVSFDYAKTAFSYSVTGVSFALLFWEKWLWSWRVFRGWLTHRPDIRGTWKGHLISSWVDPNTNQGRGPIEVYLVVRETYSTKDVRLLTDESGSVSLSGHVVADGEGIHTVAVVYENTPRALLRERSPIGHGGMLLHVRGVPVHQLDGEYWTDRKTKGELTFKLRTKQLCHDFDQAQKIEYKSA